MEVNRVADRRGLIKSRFRHKKVLIVLDDADHLDQLNALVGSDLTPHIYSVYLVLNKLIKKNTMTK